MADMRQSNEPASPPGDGGLIRLRLDVCYDGTDFFGWAAQPGLRTVEQMLQDALSTLARAEHLRLTVAGRTDAGVHAEGQVAHLDLDAARWHELSDTALRRLNGLLPGDVRVLAITVAPPGFDARFSALWRSYRYRISDADFGVRPLRRRDTALWRRALDAPAMHAAAQRLLGLRDFAAFCKRREGATTIRTLQRLDVVRDGDAIEIHARSDAFCHSMVRSLVGALAAVGEGRRDADWLAGLLELGSRSGEVTVAPPHGLTLVAVGYPSDAELAGRAEQTRAIRVSPG